MTAPPARLIAAGTIIGRTSASLPEFVRAMIEGYNVFMRFVLNARAITLWLAPMMLLALLQSPAARAQTTLPTYPENSEGLKQLFADLLGAAQERQGQKVYAFMHSLLLPDANKWFTDTFGEEIGRPLAEEYTREMEKFPAAMTGLFLRLANPKDLKITVTAVEQSDDPNARIHQRFALAAMANPVPLYTVRLQKENSSSHITLWSIVYVDGGFRLAGKMESIREAIKAAEKKQQQQQR
ncbi:MAG TPA: hypothetical protein VNL70_06705 [Tepidisphaeraceae bacterium]|nr:hypothetical protein [Tepidisphaeraceae bacterium]